LPFSSYFDCILYGQVSLKLQRAQTSARIRVFICGPMPMTMETDLRGTITPAAVRLTPISLEGTISSNCRCSVIGRPQGIPGLKGLLTS
jgi:hypothetical protein